MTRAAGRHQEGPVRAAGRPGGRRAVRDRDPGVPRRRGGVRDARPAHRPVLREPHVGLLRAAADVHRRPGRRVDPGRRAGLPRGVEATRHARAHLGDQARRGRRRALRRRRAGGAVRLDRRRRVVVAQRVPLEGAPGRRLAARRRRARAALDLPVARRPRAPGRRRERRGGVDHRGRRTDLAHRLHGPRARVHARGSPRGHQRAVRAQHAPGADPRPSGCSCSSTATSTAATTRARAGTRSAPGCRAGSGSRW